MMDISTIEYVGFERILKRGTGKVIEENERALFLYDTVSEVYFLACEEFETGMDILDRHINDDCKALMVTNTDIAEEAIKRFGFEGPMDCYQFVYCDEQLDEGEFITTRTATDDDLPMLFANYDLVGPEELRKVVESGNVMIGYAGDELIGFIGEHLEGSIGMLYIFPEHRRKGYASALEKKGIQRTIDNGFIPFGHVIKDNSASIKLQNKLGMKQTDNTVCWLWR